MIRREVHLPGQALQWLLISQVEHARISGLLAESCLLHFPETVRSELTLAIIHHDDGWASWEAQPQLDTEYHRPPSFRELPLAVSLPIWTESIEAVAQFGPLAAWVVAGHFLALLKASDRPKTLESFAVEWREEMITRREIWRSDWQSFDPELHTQDLADEALLWLQLLDVMSLWLCSVCPGGDEEIYLVPDDYRVGEGQLLETKLHYDQDREMPRIEPWRFDVPVINLQAAGWLIPKQEYSDADEWFSAKTDYWSYWQLTKK